MILNMNNIAPLKKLKNPIKLGDLSYRTREIKFRGKFQLQFDEVRNVEGF